MTKPGRLLDCPECGLAAEALLDESQRATEFANLVCIAGHRFALPVDLLPLACEDRPSRSRVRQLAKRLTEIWKELDCARRRVFEIQTGIRVTGR